jgi:AAA domain
VSTWTDPGAEAIPFGEDLDMSRLPPPLPDEQVPWWEWQQGKRPPGWTDADERKWGGDPSPAPASDDAPPAERMRLTVIGNVQAKRVDWLEDKLIARAMLTGLVAPGGTVKGLYGIHLAAKLAARGEKTLFLCSEDALDYIIRPRFTAADCDGRLAVALEVESASGARALRFPSDLAVLAEAIESVAPRLVIIDPVASYIDSGLDMSKNNEMRAILQPLITLAAESGTAIVPVYHLGKNRQRGAIGTVAFEDACRQVLTGARDDEDEDVRHLELTKTNISRTGYGRKLRIVEVPVEIDGEMVNVAKLVDEGRSQRSVHELLDSAKRPGPEPIQRESVRALLSESLAAAEGAGLDAGELRKQVEAEAGVSQATIWRGFDELREEGLVGASPERDEFGSIKAWKWFAKTALLVGRGDA